MGRLTGASLAGRARNEQIRGRIVDRCFLGGYFQT